MSDLISRQDAIDAIEELDWYHQNRDKDMVSGANSNEHQAWYKAEDVYQTLDNIPSAQKKGHWIGIDDYPYESWECDQCGCIYEEIPSWVPNYCPNCRARMARGEEE